MIIYLDKFYLILILEALSKLIYSTNPKLVPLQMRKNNTTLNYLAK
jgi:hypothetical protein